MTRKWTEKTLRRAVAKNLTHLQTYPDIMLQLTPGEAWCLLAQLQLACRHPDNNGPSRKVAEEIARYLQTAVATTPALAELAARGWDPTYDTPTAAPSACTDAGSERSSP